MASWWQKPYPGGPAVTTIQLPRPLYPPDAKGYTPSDPGPDIKAAKRCISRAGRWPWQSFDASFSNGFSHGKAGGNVGDSGIAGYQRQMKIEPTGYVGEKTYNSWRNARIPAGLPNAGQPIMDANAINLFAEAWEIYKGKPTPPPSTGTVRNAALVKAQSQIGYAEGPNNSTKYGEWYGVNYQPWCAIFVTWCFLGVAKSNTFVKGSRYAYVPYVVSDAQNARYGLSITNSPIAGDLVCFDWDGGDYDHIGIFESGNASTFKTIEGNTSTANQSNGGEVMRRSRDRGQTVKLAFVRVSEP